MLEYKRIKSFAESDLAELFLSVNWFSGKYPEKLKVAFENSDKVISAWDDTTLVGLIRGLDDGTWQATIDCLLVHPEYQGRGIASALLESLLEEYADFMYVTVVPENKSNVPFYEKHGFFIMENGTAMQKKGKTLNY